MKYNALLRHRQSQELRKEIYLYILRYFKQHGYAPSIKEICDKTDVSRETVWRHIRQLMDDGLLSTDNPGTDRAYTPTGYGFEKVKKLGKMK